MPLQWGHWALIYYKFLGPHQSTPQTTLRSVYPLSQDSRSKKTDTQTNRPRYMCNSRLFLILCIAMWPKKYKVNESFWAGAALRALLGESTRYSESLAVGGREGHRSPSPSRRRSDARLDVRALTLYRAIAGHVDSSFRHSSIVFYRAMLCIRGTSHGPVSVRPSARPPVCPPQVGVLLKRLNVGSHKQHHTIVIRLYHTLAR